MIAEILATGDEIRTGALVDSNSAYLAEKLEEIGVVVQRHTAVGDNTDQLVSTLLEIGSRVDIALVTGGLGPTTDDLSTDAAARAAKVGLRMDVRALADIEAIFKRLQRPLGASNRKQALLPEGAEVLYNPVGTAPGFALTIGRCRFFFMPGVPPEMKKMMTDKVLPRIQALLGTTPPISLIRTIRTFGLPESAVGEQVAGVCAQFPQVQLGLRAKFPEIQVKLYLRGTDGDALGQQMNRAVEWVRNRLGAQVVSDNGDAMEAVVGTQLADRGSTLAVAESCTGGLISHWLTNVAGSSDYFLFSGVTYANAAKVKVLGVSPQTLEREGAVSVETARQMAVGARRLCGADYGLATSGIAGPGGGTPQKPVGTVCIGLATPRSSKGLDFYFPYGKRRMKKKLFAMAALDLLRRSLAGLPERGRA